ncbi:hypothetical protein [Tenacibaculum amylolyticum]|uniref:hypothetical protein n=1 Tax=Tenacibaculum amylolyticum TaxID=104269 RepID=UPI0038937022
MFFKIKTRILLIIALLLLIKCGSKKTAISNYNKKEPKLLISYIKTSTKNGKANGSIYEYKYLYDSLNRPISLLVKKDKKPNGYSKIIYHNNQNIIEKYDVSGKKIEVKVIEYNEGLPKKINYFDGTKKVKSENYLYDSIERLVQIKTTRYKKVKMDSVITFLNFKYLKNNKVEELGKYGVLSLREFDTLKSPFTKIPYRRLDAKPLNNLISYKSFHGGDLSSNIINSYDEDGYLIKVVHEFYNASQTYTTEYKYNK